MRRKTNSSSDDSGFTVSGPGCDGRQAPNVGAAMSLALALATRADGDCTFYVRDAAGKTAAICTRTGKRYETRLAVAA